MMPLMEISTPISFPLFFHFKQILEEPIFLSLFLHFPFHLFHPNQTKPNDYRKVIWLVGVPLYFYPSLSKRNWIKWKDEIGQVYEYLQCHI